jgi:hypothetical protein
MLFNFAIISTYAQDNINNEKTDLADSIDNEELKAIDELAQQYYDYYVQEGYIENGRLTVETDELRNIILDEDGNLIEGQAQIESISLGQVSTILRNFGAYLTTTQVAQECAILGTLAGLDGPMPVGDFLALCVGVFFVADHISNYINHETAIVSEIRANVSDECADNAEDHVAQDTIVRNNRNYDHFACTLNYGAGGGIIIQRPLTRANAVTRLRAGDDVWSRSSVLAESIAKSASPINSVVPHSPHQEYEKPMNRPHYHPAPHSYGDDSHSFY